MFWSIDCSRQQRQLGFSSSHQLFSKFICEWVMVQSMNSSMFALLTIRPFIKSFLKKMSWAFNNYVICNAQWNQLDIFFLPFDNEAEYISYTSKSLPRHLTSECLTFEYKLWLLWLKCISDTLQVGFGNSSEDNWKSRNVNVL